MASPGGLEPPACGLGKTQSTICFFELPQRVGQQVLCYKISVLVMTKHLIYFNPVFAHSTKFMLNDPLYASLFLCLKVSA